MSQPQRRRSNTASSPAPAGQPTSRTAPAGYRSTYEAMLDYVRFGPGLWQGRPAHFLTLLFHIERSAPWGKEADAHGTSQAARGVISRKQGGEAIRGPAGVSPSTYHQANNELIKAGLLQRTRRELRQNHYLASEYEVSWEELHRQIREYQNRLAYEAAPLFASLAQPLPEPAEPEGGAVRLPDSPPPVIGQGPSGNRTHKVSDPQGFLSPVGEWPASKTAEAEDTSSHPPTVSSPASQPSPKTPSQEAPAAYSAFFEPPEAPTSPKPIREALELVCGPLPADDPIPGELAALGERVGVSGQVVAAWVAAKAREKWRQHGPRREWTPGFYRTAAPLDLLPWCCRNTLLVRAIHAEEQPRRAQVIELPHVWQPPAPASPAAPEWLWCPLCRQQRQLLIDDIALCLSQPCDPNGQNWEAARQVYGDQVLPDSSVGTREAEPVENAEPNLSAEISAALDQQREACAAGQSKLWAAATRLLHRLREIAPRQVDQLEQEHQRRT